jgi:hypothetical protein
MIDSELDRVGVIIRGVLEGFEDADGQIRDVPSGDILVEIMKALDD